MMRTKPKVAIVHPQLWGGGGDAILPWIIEALRDEYIITVITFSNINALKLNSFYGCKLSDKDFLVRKLTLPKFFKHRFSLLKRHWIMRYCKTKRSDFDLFISTQNEMDFGVPGIQYIHFPVHEELRREIGELSEKWYYNNSPLRSFYKTLSEKISSFSQENMRRNLTLVNSNWTGSMVKSAYDIICQTVYPPVPTDFPDIPWDKRENGFVCVGKLLPKKKIEKVIKIIGMVREKGWDVHLHIIGPPGEDKAYVERIKDLCVENSSWIFLEGALPRQDLVKLVSKHKFGIHGFEYEHFGIAIAEMVKAGCIVFVPNGGGQVEIVNDPRLIYQNEEEAVKKICEVLSNPSLETVLRKRLGLNAERFSVDNFMESVKKKVREFLRERTEKVDAFWKN